MPNILIRDVPTAHIAWLDEQARQADMTRQAWLLKLIGDLANDFSPDLILGYVQLKSPEFDESEVECPECGGLLVRPHIGFSGNLAPFGPVCHICATTD